MWNFLIGVRAIVVSTNEIGPISRFCSINGERSVVLLLADGTEICHSLSAVKLLGEDLDGKIEEIDKAILELQNTKFSLLNFFLNFPERVLKEE